MKRGVKMKKLLLKLKVSNEVIRSIEILPKGDRRKISFVLVIQIIMGLMDLLGIALIGVLGSLAVTGVQSQNPTGRVLSFINFLGLSENTFQTQAAILGSAAVFVLVSRTVLSVIFTRRILYFLSSRAAIISARLSEYLFSRDLLTVQQKSNQEIIYSLTTGVNVITVGIIGTLVNTFSDLTLLFIMMSGLFLVDAPVALITILMFGSLGLVLYRVLHKRAQRLGENDADLSIRSTELITELLLSYREATVRNRRSHYSKVLETRRRELANTLAEIAFMPFISKYIIETAVILGALAISASQFIAKDASHAVATLSIFMAAGTRIAPAVLRVQQSAVTIKGSVGAAGPTLDLLDAMQLSGSSGTKVLIPNSEIFENVASIRNTYFRYPGKESFAVRDINLDIKSGTINAIVGPSGAGKTTLVDLILGVIKPDSGEILVSNHTPAEAVKVWPGSISYVPQEISIFKGTLRHNIALGFPENFFSDAEILEALDVSQLSNFLADLPNGLNTAIGEAGFRLSGGQRQRIGIARALITKPKMLIMDEATSALDGETELSISKSIQELKGKVSIVLIAHRLSTVRNADKVFYMENGEILAAGKFEEVRNKVENFNNQANLMGL
jgi:ABC-type multidrug transport system fused ATPase/permease subunit